MKQKFLALTEKVKATGVAEAFFDISNEEELKEVWDEFLDENQELIEKINSWKDEYKENKTGEIFAEGEEIQNAMEVAIIIYIMDDPAEVSEDELCEDPNDLAGAIKDIGNKFAVTLGELMEYALISDISAEEIFFEE